MDSAPLYELLGCLFLFHEAARKKFLSLAASLLHADDAIRTKKSCNIFSGIKLLTILEELICIGCIPPPPK